ncbi:MAG TPA: hypothetical protein VMB52_04420 [Verrucomicrobiae bacterium]|nr:hypothetical protein [Verrucomicrobiae bacterium]
MAKKPKTRIGKVGNWLKKRIPPTLLVGSIALSAVYAQETGSQQYTGSSPAVVACADGSTPQIGANANFPVRADQIGHEQALGSLLVGALAYDLKENPTHTERVPSEILSKTDFAETEDPNTGTVTISAAGGPFAGAPDAGIDALKPWTTHDVITLTPNAAGSYVLGPGAIACENGSNGSDQLSGTGLDTAVAEGVHIAATTDFEDGYISSTLATDQQILAKELDPNLYVEGPLVQP